MSQSSSMAKVKPLLRGYLHQEAFFIALGACALLLVKVLITGNSREILATSIYSTGLLLLFGTSAIYHRPYWTPNSRAILKRLDHAAIFILIASTFTPICLLALVEGAGARLLTIIWIAAALGILQAFFWVSAPKFVKAIFYIFMGWLALPYLEDLRLVLGPVSVGLIVAGGVVYSVGAVFYVLKRPNLFPGVFGYHELFHFMTIIGAGLHFAVIYKLIS